MTDPSSAHEPTSDPGPGAGPVPDPEVRDPGSGQQPNPADTFSMDQQMKIGDTDENGLLESSMRLKPHEAQSYRKKALWVSLVSIVVTVILAIAAFSLLESSMRLKPHEAQSYRKKALWVSLVSIVVTVILAIAAFTVSVMRHSASAFGFAFDATLDVLSSIIVLWRYSNAAAVHSAHREYIACVILGVVFILSAITILVKAIHDLATKLRPEVDDFLYSVSIISGVVCAILSIFKFMLGRVLTSRALITDGFNSLVGAIMGFSILISAEVFKHEPSVWYLDASIGFLIGLIILAYGVKLLKDTVPRVRQTRNYERFE